VAGTVVAAVVISSSSSSSNDNDNDNDTSIRLVFLRLASLVFNWYAMPA
jgi:hypothetical protein